VSLQPTGIILRVGVGKQPNCTCAHHQCCARTCCIGLAHTKCSGRDDRASNIHTTFFLNSTWRKLRRLGMPISSHCLFRWTLSTSSRVGARRSCMQRLDADSNDMDIMLMATCKPASSLAAKPQSPRKSSPSRDPDGISYLLRNTKATARFAMQVRAATAQAPCSTILLLEPQASHHLALDALRFASGMNGPRRDADANSLLSGTAFFSLVDSSIWQL
jgi:hypothetical protein